MKGFRGGQKKKTMKTQNSFTILKKDHVIAMTTKEEEAIYMRLPCFASNDGMFYWIL